MTDQQHGRLYGKRAFITGGAAGIGEAIVRRFVEEGCSKTVFIDIVDEEVGNSISESILSCLNRSSDIVCQYVRCDVSKEDEVSSVLKTYFEHEGLDILVNNAAVFVFGSIEDMTDEVFERAFGVNVKGYCWTVKHALPMLKQNATSTCSASVINIGSISSFIAQPSFIPYNTTKGAVLQLTRCLAMDLAPFHIRVNAVCPGGILTPATTRHANHESKTLEQMEQELACLHLIPRLGKPKEVANAVLFLASDEASFITGHPLMVDGGWSVR